MRIKRAGFVTGSHMRNTTLCYLERDGKYLMMHRVKKENDLNHNKWVGVGGKFEENESPEECVCREVLEETGLHIHKPSYRGIVTFVSDVWEGEYMHVFTASNFTGTQKECDEGDLAWIDIGQVPHLPIWIGDRIFLKLLADNAPFFSLKLCYRGDELIRAILNGSELDFGAYVGTV